MAPWVKTSPPNLDSLSGIPRTPAVEGEDRFHNKLVFNLHLFIRTGTDT